MLKENIRNSELFARTYRWLKRYEFLRRIYRETKTGKHILFNKLRSLLSGGAIFASRLNYSQTILRGSLLFEEFRDWRGLREQLEEREIFFSEGRHTIYLPPESVSKFVKNAASTFPSETGLKILKSFEDPSNVTYIENSNIRTMTTKMMGPIETQAVSAACLSVLDMGPKCYGLVHFENEKINVTAFAVEHAVGIVPDSDTCKRFIEKLEEYHRMNLFDIVSPLLFEDPDFRCPDCNNNLILNEKQERAWYVDFQQFVFDQERFLKWVLDDAESDLHFGGSSSFFRGGKEYLYQQIPGVVGSSKRDTEYRWQKISGILDRHGYSFEGRVAMDICCNSGIFIAKALSTGAFWGIGWDLPNVAHHASKILTTLGATRQNIIATTLENEYEIRKDIPNWLLTRMDTAIVFYLAATQSVGIMKHLGDVDWELLVYEGHEGDTESETEDNYKTIEKRWKCKLLHKSVISDGDCGTRSLALFRRS